MILAEENPSTARNPCLYVTLSTVHSTWTCLEMRRARECLKQLGIYGRLIFNCILGKWNVEGLDGFSCPRRLLMADLSEHADTERFLSSEMLRCAAGNLICSAFSKERRHFILTLSNPIFLPPAYSPALIYFGRERGWWITCNYPTVLKETNINRKSTTCVLPCPS
jgi:hypothetical protein